MALARWHPLFAALLLLLLVPGCGTSVTGAIDAQVQAGSPSVDLGGLTDFEWDRLVIFGPYSYPKQMCYDLELSSSECASAAFEHVDEGHFVLVFMNGGRISHREEFSRFIGNFDDGCLATPMPRAEARFGVEGRGGGLYLTCRGLQTLPNSRLQRRALRAAAEPLGR